MDEQEKQEKKRLNAAMFTAAGICIGACVLLLMLLCLLAGYRFSPEGAAGRSWREADCLELGAYTLYYTTGEEGNLENFAMVKRSGPCYKRITYGGQPLYPRDSKSPAGILYSYRDKDCWRHVLLLNGVLPAGIADGPPDSVEARGVTCPVSAGGCFTTEYSVSELTLNAITLTVEKSE